MMYAIQRFILILIFQLILTIGFSQQFGSAVYMSSNLIEDKDISVYDTVTFSGWTMVEAYDRRIPDYVLEEVAVYKVIWKDGTEMEIQVFKEIFDDYSMDSILNAIVVPFGHKVGQLPFFLLNGIDRLVIMKGKESWSASLGSIYIHLDLEKINSKFVEEILMHEGGHAALDEYYRESGDWKIAQKKDSISLSEYGEEDLVNEDLTESIIFWLAVNYKSQRIFRKDSIKIRESMPHRLAFIDSLNLDVYPLNEPNEFDYLYVVNRGDEYDLNLENAISFQEFMTKLGLILFAFVALLIIRKMYFTRS